MLETARVALCILSYNCSSLLNVRLQGAVAVLCQQGTRMSYEMLLWLDASVLCADGLLMPHALFSTMEATHRR